MRADTAANTNVQTRDFKLKRRPFFHRAALPAELGRRPGGLPSVAEWFSHHQPDRKESRRLAGRRCRLGATLCHRYQHVACARLPAVDALHRNSQLEAPDGPPHNRDDPRLRHPRGTRRDVRLGHVGRRPGEMGKRLLPERVGGVRGRRTLPPAAGRCARAVRLRPAARHSVSRCAAVHFHQGHRHGAGKDSDQLWCVARRACETEGRARRAARKGKRSRRKTKNRRGYRDGGRRCARRAGCARARRPDR